MSSSDDDPESGPVPVAIRAVIAEQLTALVRGELPDLLDEVHAYPAVGGRFEATESPGQTSWSSGKGPRTRKGQERGFGRFT